MNQQWTDTEVLREGENTFTFAPNYSAHPLLDPSFPTTPGRVGYYFRKMFDRIQNDDVAYQAEMTRMLNPPGASSENLRKPEDMIRVFTEADTYIQELITLLPNRSCAAVTPNPQVSACNDMRTLMEMLFTAEDPVLRFEAQRKMYLAKLLLDIEHSFMIQDGPKHKAYFDELLQNGLWNSTTANNKVEIGFNIAEDKQHIKYNLSPRDDQQQWLFNSKFLEKKLHDRTVPIDILYYNSRFKKSVTPISFELIDGSHKVVEKKRWDGMRSQSNGSILSKMIRKGINNPDEIGDLLGAMFIVYDENAVDELLTLLDNVLGNPIGWRNITDSFKDTQNDSELNKHSGKGYQVFKGDLDILYPNLTPELPPYRFPVEIQIYTLEGFLRTVCGTHSANHLALKLRQFLHGLAPMIFPESVYGKGWMQPL
ncbi:hypothetical protein HN388_07660 [bacterium]|nr:hypothetical protein [bacterium]MBT4291875.1 hypothetical protein [bacterium]